MSPLTALALVVLAGLPLAFAVTRSPVLSLALAPLVTGLSSAVAAIAMLVVGGDLRLWIGLAVAGTVVAAALLLRGGRERVPHATWVDAAWLILPQLLPALRLRYPPVAWDAHSIWWLHAGYFTHGAAFARHAIGSDGLAFSHPDYPPLTSAAVAGAWLFTGSTSFRVAQVVCTALTIASIIALGYAVRTVTASAPALVSRLLAVAATAAGWGIATGAATSGLSDALWTTAFVAAAVLLTIDRRSPAGLVLPIGLLTVAVLTKNEALPVTALLIVALAARRWRTPVRALPLAVPLVLAGGWVLLSRHLGARSDVTAGAHIGGLVTGDPKVYSRFQPIFTSLWDHAGWTVLVAALVAVTSAVLLRHRRSELGMGSDLWLWGLAAAYTASLSATYAISNIGIDWYLITSMVRVIHPLILLACVSLACWGAVAATRPGAPAPRPPRIPIPGRRTSRRPPHTAPDPQRHPARLPRGHTGASLRSPGQPTPPAAHPTK